MNTMENEMKEIKLFVQGELLSTYPDITLTKDQLYEVIDDIYDRGHENNHTVLKENLLKYTKDDIVENADILLKQILRSLIMSELHDRYKDLALTDDQINQVVDGVDNWLHDEIHHAIADNVLQFKKL